MAARKKNTDKELETLAGIEESIESIRTFRSNNANQTIAFIMGELQKINERLHEVIKK